MPFGLIGGGKKRGNVSGAANFIGGVGAAIKGLKGYVKRSRGTEKTRAAAAREDAARRRNPAGDPLIEEYHRLIAQDPEAKLFFNSLSKMIKQETSVGYFNGIDKNNGKRIAVLMFKSGFDVSRGIEARNFFIAVAQNGLMPKHLRSVVEALFQKRAEERQESGGHQTTFMGTKTQNIQVLLAFIKEMNQ